MQGSIAGRALRACLLASLMTVAIGGSAAQAAPTFAPPVASPFAAGTNPYSVTGGDFDKDGDTDLATANEGSDDVSVLINDGDGTFAPAAPVAAGTDPRSVTGGDLDNDGDTDLATANNGSNDVSVLLNDGDGTFAPAPPLSRPAPAPTR